MITTPRNMTVIFVLITSFLLIGSSNCKYLETEKNTEGVYTTGNHEDYPREEKLKYIAPQVKDLPMMLDVDKLN